MASTKKPNTLQPLFDAVYATPDDDTPRLVLGDALMEIGVLRAPSFRLGIVDGAMLRGGRHDFEPLALARHRTARIRDHLEHRSGH